MDENVLPDENPGSPLKQQGSLGKNSSNHKPALGQRSPLKDIANHPSEARTVKNDIKYDAVCQLHEDEVWHEGTEIVTHIDRTAHHKFAYEIDEDIRIISEMKPELAVGKLLHRDVADFREVTGLSLGDTESEYESAEDSEEIEKPFIKKIVSPLAPAVNSTLLQATSSANCTPARSDDVFENSLLNIFENMKITETDEPTLEEKFHDASDVMENIVKLSPHSRKVPEENRSTETKVTEQPTESSKKESEILPNKNEYSCVLSLDKKDSSQCSQSVTERAVDMEPLRKETTKKEAMIYTGKESSDELVENVDPPDQKCDQVNFLNKLEDTNFDPFTKKTNMVNSPNKMDALFVTEGETSCEMAVTTVVVEAKKTVLQKEGIVPEKKDNIMEKEDTFLEKNDPVLESKHTVSEKNVTVLVSECNVLEKKDTNSEEEDTYLEMEDTASEKEGPSLEKEFTALENEETSQERENAFNTQMETKKETSPDDSMSKVMLEKKSVKKSKNVRKSDEGKTPISQESNVRDSTFDTLSTKSAIVNSPYKKEFSVVDKEKTQSQKAKTGITPKRKQEKWVICEKETLSSQKEVIEAAAKDGLPPQKCYQMDFLSKLDDPNLDPFATKSSIVNSPEKKDLSLVNEEETQSQKLKIGIIPEKKQDARVICKEKETQVSLQKVVVEAAVKDSAPLQKCYQINNLDDPTFDPFRTKAAVQNSPVRKENAFNIHMETEEKTNREESGLKGVTEERYIKKLEKIVTKSDQNKSPVFQEDSKRDCHKKVEQNVILKSEEIKKVVSVVTPSTCQMVEKKQASTAGSDQRDVFSPLPKGRARTQGYPGVFNFEEEFTSASDFFNTPEDLDVLGTHGTEGDKLNLVRNSLYVKFDPLVSGRQSLAPYLAQQVKESELDPRRCSGLISFSPSPIKGQRDSNTTGTPVRALLSTRADETVVLDTTDLDNTTVTVGGNTTFVSCNQTFNNTVICSSAPDSANETIIHQPVVNGEKMVTEREMNEKLKNMELIMQDNEMRKCREYEGVQKSFKQQIMEDGIALTALEEENSALKSSIQQMQETLTKILQQDKAKKKEHRNQLQLLENQYELKCAALQKECQQYQDELKKSEVPFFDLVKKYERLREVLECLRRNEESLKSDNERLKTKMAQKEENFKTVIQTYEDKLGMTENEICSLKQNCQQDLKKASVMLKKAEVKILSLTEMVEKLNTERERLTDLLEDITNSMGTTSAM